MARRRIRNRVIATLIELKRPLFATEIADIVYGDDPDGGPLSATETIWSTIRDLKLEGHRIVAGSAGGYTYLGRAA